jgi:hypothetical protein
MKYPLFWDVALPSWLIFSLVSEKLIGLNVMGLNVQEELTGFLDC